MLPNQTGTEYTSPTIRIGEDFIVDSKVIAAELEKRFPEPSLHLDAPELEEIYATFGATLKPLIMVIMPRVVNRVVSPISSKYLAKGTQDAYGKSLDELEKERGGEQAYEGAKESWKPWEAILKRREGPFVLGHQGRIWLFYCVLSECIHVVNLTNTPAVSYADFIIVSILCLARRAGEDIFLRIVDMFPVFGSLYDACKGWTARDDH